MLNTELEFKVQDHTSILLFINAALYNVFLPYFYIEKWKKYRQTRTLQG